ncbi:DUF4346 domain-containing protein [Candidatus Synechococcus spongiarum]|uniref:DUF4346 domain-containing protein n=1 Tax=Candidatus Synechococcus spongiarum TaxID=431041 RepID=UPI00046EFBFD|nr:DUF4346 domain-containing protein [Candidatus Synechococcus spongiarum]
MAMTPQQRRRHDDRLSRRAIALDPSGYFLIFLDRDAGDIVAEHYSNIINDQGLAADPETGEVLACRDGDPRQPVATYRGCSAKEVGIRLVEEADPCPVSRLDHALYLGRELQRAEACLESGRDYVQD